MRILVAEDAKDLNRLIVKTLAKAGYSVDGCFNGEEALDYAGGAEYDVKWKNESDYNVTVDATGRVNLG